MKLLIIDLDGNKNKSLEFSSAISKFLDVEPEFLTISKIKNTTKYSYEKFVRAGFSLEEKLLNDYKNINSICYCNVIYVWGNYSIDNIELLKPYQNIFLKDLIVFPTTRYDKNFDWVFGNVIAMTKFSTSLHKMNINLLQNNYDRYKYDDKNLELLQLMWYPIRIGLDVRGLSND